MEKLTGQVVFRQAGPATPVHHLRLRVAPTHLLAGEGEAVETDLDGRFALPWGDHARARVHVLDGDKVLSTVERDVPASGDLGVLPVAFWPYRSDTPTPRAAAIDGHLPQSYATGFTVQLVEAFARTTPAKLALQAKHLLGAERPTIDEIQAHQPMSATQRADASSPGRSRSDAWLADQLLNGFHVALDLGPDAARPQGLRAVMGFGELPAREDGGGYDLYDVDARMIDRDGELVVDEIHLRVRSPGVGGAFAADQRWTARVGDARWEAAKGVVRCQLLLHGAVDGHIIRTHFQTEAFAIAAFRNLRRNPVRRLIAPHLQEIVAQDHDGDSFAWGPEGILVHLSALTPTALQERMARLPSGWCWSTVGPRPVLHPSHRFARAEALFFALVRGVAADFVRAHEAEIVAEWAEVRRFSDDLHGRSPVFHPYPAVVGAPATPPAAGADGVRRCHRPLTTTDQPGPGELDDLVQLLTVILHTATFLHSWTHDGQYEAGGELRYATFALRAGSVGVEGDPTVWPTPAAMIEGIATNSVGMHVDHGRILADEDGDIWPPFKAAVAAARADFLALGVDVDRLRSRINL